MKYSDSRRKKSVCLYYGLYPFHPPFEASFRYAEFCTHSKNLVLLEITKTMKNSPCEKELLQTAIPGFTSQIKACLALAFNYFAHRQQQLVTSKVNQ